MATLAGNTRVSGTRLFWVVILLALSVLLNYVDRGAIGVAAPLMIDELDFTATEFGTAVSAFFWVYAPLCLFVGWLCDRFCVYRMFAAGIALWALATLLTGFVNGLVLLIVLRLLLGLGVGAGSRRDRGTDQDGSVQRFDRRIAGGIRVLGRGGGGSGVRA